jgi:hypothetical protein
MFSGGCYKEIFSPFLNPVQLNPFPKALQQEVVVAGEGNVAAAFRVRLDTQVKACDYMRSRG